jgi:acyl-[acyl-carrier-protein] desaturase
MSKLETNWLRAELEPTVTQNLDRHLGAAKERMPHEFVPWSQGRDFARSGPTRPCSPATWSRRSLN